MTRRIDLTGNKFGAWLVTSYAGCNDIGQPSWKCVCDCGTRRVVVGQTLRTGASKSCGCEKSASIARAITKHGEGALGKQTREYRAWQAMRNRVRPNNERNRKWYSDNGVIVCERWGIFSNFLEDMGRCPSGMSLDRINPYGNYEPSNCRWADAVTQRRNQRIAA